MPKMFCEIESIESTLGDTYTQMERLSQQLEQHFHAAPAKTLVDTHYTGPMADLHAAGYSMDAILQDPVFCAYKELWDSYATKYVNSR